MTEERVKLAWGAAWLLPDKWTAAWGARGIADKNCRPESDDSHVVGLLYDRQSAAGNNAAVKELLSWINGTVLPIFGAFYGDGKEVFKKDDGDFHARWTENASYGYVYVVAWMD
jgi:hypothetical protein